MGDRAKPGHDTDGYAKTTQGDMPSSDGSIFWRVRVTLLPRFRTVALCVSIFGFPMQVGKFQGLRAEATDFLTFRAALQWVRGHSG
jgi:hypothetical protein